MVNSISKFNAIGIAIDEPIEGECEDYLGNRCSISQLSGIHLEACPYSFSIEDQFME